MRVGEGSPKKKEIEKMEKLLKKHSKIGLEKVMENVWKNLQKVIQKGGKN